MKIKLDDYIKSFIDELDAETRVMNQDMYYDICRGIKFDDQMNVEISSIGRFIEAHLNNDLARLESIALNAENGLHDALINLDSVKSDKDSYIYMIDSFILNTSSDDIKVVKELFFEHMFDLLEDDFSSRKFESGEYNSRLSDLKVDIRKLLNKERSER